MKLYYVEICQRVAVFTIRTYKEYFVSDEGMQKYIDFFNKHLYAEDEMYINKKGQARINSKDMIVAED